ncbi:MAG TPA: DEAD/DEAH box helicase [Terriglobales bacterium]|jgi:ATP-dependent RNA helicase DeaD|nr:DEAD/DEAH box helicase [Terriglobales bacterium]
MAFPELHPSLLRALAARNYTEPTPVQEAVLRPATAGRDLLVSAQTGSGKTVAYGLALGPMLLGDAERLGRPQQPLALIVAPTRELALQVQRELEWLFADAGARVVSCVGGMDIRREQRMLAQGAHVVVGTPGRLSDHLDQERLDLSQIRAVVLDEADEMLDLGFREELEMLLNATPPERRTMLFSATLPKAILGLAKRYQRNALRLALSSENEPHGDIEYRAFAIRPRDSEHAVVNSLRYFDAPGALVFCSTRESVRHLHTNLQERGFSAVALSGELKQYERTNALQALRDGRARVCVATDVAARGLDMPDLGLVIHADLPQNRQALLHRSGRTGRAGRKGLSVVLVPAPQRSAARRLFASAKIQATWSPAPSADAIRERDEEKLVREVAAMAEAPAEEDLAAGRVLLAERSPEQIAAVLIRLRRELLPAPEVLGDPGPERPESRAHKTPFGGRRGWAGRPVARDNKHRGFKWDNNGRKFNKDKKVGAKGKPAMPKGSHR